MASKNILSIFKEGLFKNKVAIVTGGGSGIGKAIAKDLLSLGCKVVIASRSQEKLEKAAQELGKSLEESCPPAISPISCNIRKEDEVKQLFKTTLEKYGQVDYVVNNGGGQFLAFAKDISLKGWNAVIETNLTGTFLMCKEAYHQWMEEHGGSIVNILMDFPRGVPLMSHSAAARAGSDNLTKSLAIEWAHCGIRVNAVAPGSSIYSETAAANYGEKDVFEVVRPHLPTQRLGIPEEISAAVCFLLSPGASFITGHTLFVDGGGSLYTPPLYKVPEHDKLPPYSRL